jgi:hypothetical protein
MNKVKIYLDDFRTPTDKDWIVVRSYNAFVDTVNYHGLENIEFISLDHDLDPTAMQEYFNNVSPNYTLDYNKIKEPTGLHAAKFLIEKFYEENDSRMFMPRSERKRTGFVFPTVWVHSANPIGSANIMGYLNNFYMNEGEAQTCIRVMIEHENEHK